MQQDRRGKFMLLSLNEFKPLGLSATANITGLLENLVSLWLGGRLVIWRKVIRESR